MPIYEYKCEKCEHKLEAMQKINEDPLRHCPNCSKDTLKREVSIGSFILKGDGWFNSERRL